jgi:hypothetical protein
MHVHALIYLSEISIETTKQWLCMPANYLTVYTDKLCRKKFTSVVVYILPFKTRSHTPFLYEECQPYKHIVR